MKNVYLDNAAATPLDDEALHAMLPFFADSFHNPSALYLSAKNAKNHLEDARASIAKCMGVQPGTLVFTGSGTEANNLAISGIMSQYADNNVGVSAVEHEAVLEPAKKYKHKIFPVLSSGIVSPETVISLIDDDTVLVSVMYVNNEIGTIQPIKEIGSYIAQLKKDRIKKGNTTPIYFHTDACQAPNYVDIHVHKLGVDMMTLNSSKVYGPKGVGVLYVAPHVRLQPIISGGGQEYGLRSGTENLAAIAGFAKALEKTVALKSDEASRLKAIQDNFFTAVKSHPNIHINGDKNRRIPNNIHVTIESVDNERLVYELDEKGFEVATGSACSASSDEPSHVLKAIGLSDLDARSSIRITMGRQTTSVDMERLLSIILAL